MICFFDFHGVSAGAWTVWGNFCWFNFFTVSAAFEQLGPFSKCKIRIDFRHFLKVLLTNLENLTKICTEMFPELSDGLKQFHAFIKTIGVVRHFLHDFMTFGIHIFVSSSEATAKWLNNKHEYQPSYRRLQNEIRTQNTWNIGQFMWKIFKKNFISLYKLPTSNVNPFYDSFWWENKTVTTLKAHDWKSQRSHIDSIISHQLEALDYY